MLETQAYYIGLQEISMRVNKWRAYVAISTWDTMLQKNIKIASLDYTIGQDWTLE